MVAYRRHAVVAEHEYLSRLDVAYQLCADSLDSAALGRDNINTIRTLTVAERTEAIRVARADQLLRRHQYKRIRAVEYVHCLTERQFDRSAFETLARDYVRYCLGIARRVEYRAGQLKTGSQFRGVRQVSVMRECHAPFLVVDLERLAVRAVGFAGCAVARVTDRDPSVRQAGQGLGRENLADQPEILV